METDAMQIASMAVDHKDDDVLLKFDSINITISKERARWLAQGINETCDKISKNKSNLKRDAYKEVLDFLTATEIRGDTDANVGSRHKYSREAIVEWLKNNTQ